MISGIRISSSELIVQSSQTAKTKSVPFAKGQVISAKVLAADAKGQALLLINGKKITAQTEMLLTRGEEIQLKVTSEKDDIVLKLIGPQRTVSSTQIRSFLELFSNPSKFEKLAQKSDKNIQKLFMSLALKSEKSDPDFLPNLIKNSGLLLEKKLAGMVQNLTSSNTAAPAAGITGTDLKAALLSFLALETLPAGSETIQAATGFTEAIEGAQVANQSSSESGRFLLPFPIFSDSAFQLGQLLIDTGEKSQESDSKQNRVIKVSFLLNMTQLGPMRADFAILKKKIQGRFVLKDPGTCEYVESGLAELKIRMQDIGYEIQKVECHVAQTDEELDQRAMVESLVQDKTLLNIVV